MKIFIPVTEEELSAIFNNSGENRYDTNTLTNDPPDFETYQEIPRFQL